MLFCSQQFLVFFAAVFALYWLSPWPRVRVWTLLVASFVFYATWNKWLAVLITATTVLDWLLALGMDRWTARLPRRLLLALSLVVNLGLLCYFKYANFFLDSLDASLRAVGAEASIPVLNVILPFGISFYTFEAINYTIDVYRKQVPAERNLANFMLFILFFPHLVAGPIVRARDFLPQTKRRKHWSWIRAQVGVQFFLLGLFKKLAIADRMAYFSTPVFEAPEKYGTGATWLAVIAFALRIYCDFSGYTDMAIGSAHLLGYRLAQNFNMPYLAVNPSDFWRRWHISLSGWLRDYLFIPLGGSRAGEWHTARNLLVTMTLGGLWHGVSWMFVVWGVFHGVWLIAHRGFKAVCDQQPWLSWLLTSVPGTALRMATTFLLVCVGWVFFYAASLEAEQSLKVANENVAKGGRVERVTYSAWSTSWTVLHRLVVPHSGLGPPLHNRGLWYTVAVVAVAHLLGASGMWRRWAVKLPPPALGFGYAAMLTLALVLAPDTGRAFIYFQF
jgi:alginate O-acetyltransferase complex protein AlgI